MKAHNLTKGYKKDQTDLLGLSLKIKTFMEGGEASPKTILDFIKHTDDRYFILGSVQVHEGSTALRMRLGERF